MSSHAARRSLPIKQTKVVADSTEIVTTEEIPVEEVPPTVVTARHILICYDGCAVNDTFNRTQEEALELIQGIETRIQNGEITFIQAAIDYSDCPSGQDGGMLGEFGRGAWFLHLRMPHSLFPWAECPVWWKRSSVIISFSGSNKLFGHS